MDAKTIDGNCTAESTDPSWHHPTLDNMTLYLDAMQYDVHSINYKVCLPKFYIDPKSNQSNF